MYSVSSSLKVAYYVGQCTRGPNEPPLFIKMAVHVANDNAKSEIFFRRKHLATISPYFEFYAHKWIPGTEVFHIFQCLDKQARYHDQFAKIMNDALSEASERHDFQLKRALMKQNISFTVEGNDDRH